MGCWANGRVALLVDLLVEIRCCDSADGVGVFGAVLPAFLFSYGVCVSVILLQLYMPKGFKVNLRSR